MAVEILLPKIGFSMNEGQIAEWLAKDGDQISEGQPLFSLEADKSTNEVEAPASGTLRSRHGARLHRVGAHRDLDALVQRQHSRHIVT
jgi:pyruvate/2-oxoglutarate dehydrogenase complex dihydrolipoamide acyltransferase (E2) component